MKKKRKTIKSKMVKCPHCCGTGKVREDDLYPPLPKEKPVEWYNHELR